MEAARTAQLSWSLLCGGGKEAVVTTFAHYYFVIVLEMFGGSAWEGLGMVLKLFGGVFREAWGRFVN